LNKADLEGEGDVEHTPTVCLGLAQCTEGTHSHGCVVARARARVCVCVCVCVCVHAWLSVRACGKGARARKGRPRNDGFSRRVGLDLDHEDFFRQPPERKKEETKNKHVSVNVKEKLEPKKMIARSCTCDVDGAMIFATCV
jgi:hypothetical protein